MIDDKYRKRFRLYNMTYNEKKSLYESIMKETAKTVKRMINESAEYELKKDLPKEEFNKHA